MDLKKPTDEQLAEIEFMKDSWISYGNPVQTDASISQFRVSAMDRDDVFIFTEIVDNEIRTNQVSLSTYYEEEISSVCDAYGYDYNNIDNALIAECLFKLDYCY